MPATRQTGFRPPDVDMSLFRKETTSRNKEGKNQHDCPPIDDPAVFNALWEIHRTGETNKANIKGILKSKYGIELSESSITRRKKAYGILGSGATTRTLPETEKRQLIFDQMAKDPSRMQGPRTIKEGIAFDQGVHLTRDYIHETMKMQDPEAFADRHPRAKKIHRTQLVALGPNDEWSGDGHDKLTGIGFPIWGVRDVWSGKWLGLYVLPNNRLKLAIAYVWLKIVKEQGGVPIQMTTDCGSETGRVYGLATALREEYRPELDVNELPAHKFLKSIFNITIERGWLRLRLQWGENVKLFWEAGATIYNPTDLKQYMLVQWLWSTLIQSELDHLLERLNNHKVRKDKEKKNPSGARPDHAFACPEQFGGQSGLLKPVDLDVIDALMEELGGEELIQFVSPEYAARAKSVFDSLGVSQLTMENVWNIFSAMLPLM
ncbi:hypothetical protein VNI00_018299 [Paramarasmius palmivorus]|uniref:Integrase core domain-containing protein n=1 Tax=Paramarasmius palmivorus TaxID=297713 RepID=A0AAW0B2J1_9AGAR